MTHALKQCRKKEVFVPAGLVLNASGWKRQYRYLKDQDYPALPKGCRKTDSGLMAFAALGGLVCAAKRVPSGGLSRKDDLYKDLDVQTPFREITQGEQCSIESCPLEGQWLSNQRNAAKKCVFFSADDLVKYREDNSNGSKLWAPLYVALYRVGIVLADAVFMTDAQVFVDRELGRAGRGGRGNTSVKRGRRVTGGGKGGKNRHRK